MTTVSIECGRCAAVAQVSTRSLLIDVGEPPGGHADEAVGGTVSWICAACDDVISQPVPWSTLLALLSAGALLLDESEDPPPVHPESPPAGPMLSRDDVLDLHTALESPGWFADLEATVESLPAEHRQ